MNDGVVWVKVRRPVFDLGGLILSSLTLAVLLALVSAVVGTIVGLRLIQRRRASAGGPLIALNAPPHDEPVDGAE